MRNKSILNISVQLKLLIMFQFGLVLLSGCISVSFKGSTNELTKMANEDQQIRQKIADAGLPTASVLAKQMLALDSSHTIRLKDMLHGRAWFGDSDLKRRDRISAFMLLQHSPDSALQENALPILKVQADKIGPQAQQMVATLEDRVLIREGKPQIYGTQVHMIEDSLIVYPISDSLNVDSRRSSIGLPPLSMYLDMLRSKIPNRGKN
jgi:hypothetical protein